MQLTFCGKKELHLWASVGSRRPRGLKKNTVDLKRAKGLALVAPKKTKLGTLERVTDRAQRPAEDYGKDKARAK